MKIHEKIVSAVFFISLLCTFLREIHPFMAFLLIFMVINLWTTFILARFGDKEKSEKAIWLFLKLKNDQKTDQK